MIPKNYKQVLTRVSMVPNSKILFSNLSKIDKICPTISAGRNYLDTEIDVGELCEDDISCTMFEKIDFPFKYRAEQCFESLYVLMIYPEPDPAQQTEMSIQAEYVDNAPCFTVSGGVHEVVNTETQCGEKSASACEATIRCSLITCQYTDGSNRTEGVCLPRATSASTREDYCAKSGLVLADYGAEPLDMYSPWTIILAVGGVFFLFCFCAG